LSILLPYSKRLVPQSWNTSNGIFQTKRKARVELNFFEYSDSKYNLESDLVEYEKGSRLKYDLILGTETIKELGIVLDFKAKTITIDEIILPKRHQPSARRKYAPCAKTKQQRSHGTKEHRGHYQTCNFDSRLQIEQSRSPINCQRQLQASKCQPTEEVTAASHEI
jgi:hypothetical protein